MVCWPRQACRNMTSSVRRICARFTCTCGREVVRPPHRVRLMNSVRLRRSALCTALVLGNIAFAAHHEAGNEWLSVQGDLNNQRFGHLEQINRQTIAKLGAVWISEPFEDGATSRMTPLVHD